MGMMSSQAAEPGASITATSAKLAAILETFIVLNISKSKVSCQCRSRGLKSERLIVSLYTVGHRDERHIRNRHMDIVRNVSEYEKQAQSLQLIKYLRYVTLPYRKLPV